MVSDTLVCGDCLEVMREMSENSVDLVLCSPPYEAARSYGIDFNLRGDEWVRWAFERYMECVRVSRGLVAWVVEGQTRDFRWSATPALLMAELHRSGVRLRKPPIYARLGYLGREDLTGGGMITSSSSVRPRGGCHGVTTQRQVSHRSSLLVGSLAITCVMEG